jgi:hypothetical protein
MLVGGPIRPLDFGIGPAISLRSEPFARTEAIAMNYGQVQRLAAMRYKRLAVARYRASPKSAGGE